MALCSLFKVCSTFLYEIHSSHPFVINWFLSNRINAGVRNLHFELTSLCGGFVRTTNGSCVWKLNVDTCGGKCCSKTKLDLQVCLCANDFDGFRFDWARFTKIWAAGGRHFISAARSGFWKSVFLILVACANPYFSFR